MKRLGKYRDTLHLLLACFSRNRKPKTEENHSIWPIEVIGIFHSQFKIKLNIICKEMLKYLFLFP